MIIDKPIQVYHEKISRYAKALSHPVRVYIIELLSQQACCYSGDLTDVLPIAKSTLSQHLKELKNAGLIQGEIEPPKIKYCLQKDSWNDIQVLFSQFFSNEKINYICCTD